MDASQTTKTVKPQRRWLRFSLRSLLIVITLLCVWLGLKVRDAHRQREAVAAILNLRGSVRYDFQKSSGGKPNEFEPDAKPPGPQWLHTLIGPEYFQAVVLVELDGLPITDDDLDVLTKLPELETLGLSKTRISSAGLAHIAALKNLQQLSLWNTQVDDEGVKYLRNLHELWSLILDGTHVSDAGLENLEDLTNLQEWLGLSQTQVTDAGLQHLKKLSKLKSLNLIGTQVTENGARELQPFLAPNALISVHP